VGSVRGNGYRSASANFREIANQRLVNHARFIIAGRGPYRLRNGAQSPSLDFAADDLPRQLRDDLVDLVEAVIGLQLGGGVRIIAWCLLSVLPPAAM